MVIIIKNTKFHARAMKEPDFENGTLGYNFSYPVLNTIEIGNLFITGGSITIQTERIGKTVWSFDKIKSDLYLKKNELEEIYHIDNPKELYQAMSEHFQKNRDELMEENLLANEKKKIAKKGNQNAAKNSLNTCTENKSNQEEKTIAETEKLPEDFINFLKFSGTREEYFKIAKEKQWLKFLDYRLLAIGWRDGFLKIEDIPEKVLKEHPCHFDRLLMNNLTYF